MDLELYRPTKPLPTGRLSVLTREELLRHRLEHRNAVKRRLEEFAALKKASATRLFYELCYCILTPQSKGLVCDRIVADLAGRGVLLEPVTRRGELEVALQRTRFWRTKTRHILEAWRRFGPCGEEPLDALLREAGCFQSPVDFRDWLRERMRGVGVGLKETSHFLRNIGYGDGLAIIDRHVIRCLAELGVLGAAEGSIRSEGDYRRVESMAAAFSLRLQIPLAELDLLLWSAKTGYIFK
ncbi:MAG: hypothetical protein D6733_05425 [Methanobacteriota archaeon]|nr:MAG: hypothetical protein D6733_05425 [Euryarchaeota archaeon]